VNTLLFRRTEGQTEFYPRGKYPCGRNSPLWSKFAPRREVKNGLPHAFHAMLFPFPVPVWEVQSYSGRTPNLQHNGLDYEGLAYLLAEIGVSPFVTHLKPGKESGFYFTIYAPVVKVQGSMIAWNLGLL
jgi:hypothetical protein